MSFKSTLKQRLIASPQKREFLWRLLMAENSAVTAHKVDAFLVGLADTINMFWSEGQNNSNYRDAHDALRDVFQLIANPKGSVDRIRLKLTRLPQAAR